MKGLNARILDGSLTTPSYAHIDQRRLAWFLLTVVWRAALSLNTIYDRVLLGHEELQSIHTALQEFSKPSARVFRAASCSISDMFDSEGHFTRQALAELIMPPIADWWTNTPKRQSRAVMWTMHGFFCICVVPPLPSRLNKNGEFLSTRRRLHLSRFDVRSFPPFMKMIKDQALLKDPS